MIFECVFKYFLLFQYSHFLLAMCINCSINSLKCIRLVWHIFRVLYQIKVFNGKKNVTKFSVFGQKYNGLIWKWMWYAFCMKILNDIMKKFSFLQSFCHYSCRWNTGYKYYLYEQKNVGSDRKCAWHAHVKYQMSD